MFNKKNSSSIMAVSLFMSVSFIPLRSPPIPYVQSNQTITQAETPIITDESFRESNLKPDQSSTDTEVIPTDKPLTGEPVYGTMAEPKTVEPIEVAHVNPKVAEAAEATPTKPMAPESTAAKLAAPTTLHASTSAKQAQPKALDKVIINPLPEQETQKDAKTIVSASGQPLRYEQIIPVKASGYSAAAEENGWGPVDYYGNPLKLGTIAVDSSVIPLGSTVYITGYRSDILPAKGMIAKATDKGSAIKGNRVDIFIPGSHETASKFGLQNVTLYILK